MAKEQVRDSFLYDSRISQRHIRDGRLDRDEFEKFIAMLPDLKDQCEDIGDDIYRSRKPGLSLTGEFVSNERDEE